MTHYVTNWPFHCSMSFIPCLPGGHTDIMSSPELYHKGCVINHCFILLISVAALFEQELGSNSASGVCVLSGCELLDHVGKPITLPWSHSAKSPCHRAVYKHKKDFHGWTLLRDLVIEARWRNCWVCLERGERTIGTGTFKNIFNSTAKRGWSWRIKWKKTEFAVYMKYTLWNKYGN